MYSLISDDDVFRARAGTPRFQTDSLLEGRDYVRRSSAGLELRSQRLGRFEFEHWKLDLGRVQLDLLNIECEHDFEVDQVRDLDVYSCKVPFRGRCEYRIGDQRFVAQAGQVFASNPSVPISKRFIGPYRQAILSIEQAYLLEFLSAELGRPLGAELRFETAPHSGRAVEFLASLVEFVLMECRGGFSAREWRMARYLDRSLVMALLAAVPNTYSAELKGARQEVAPFYVRKAEAFIFEKLEEDISLAEIVKASGVSSRSLYYGFRRWRNTTPMGCLKEARLDRAREALRAASVNGGTITEIAVSVGYTHMGRFAGDYKARFGERPSDTLLGHAIWGGQGWRGQ